MNTILILAAMFGCPATQTSTPALPPFVQKMHEGFRESYRGPHASCYPKAKELGWGFTGTVCRRPLGAEGYFYAFLDGNGIVKVVWEHRWREDVLVELGQEGRITWVSDKVVAETREGRKVWAESSDDGFTIVNVNSGQTLESLLDQQYGWANITGKDINPIP